MTYHDDYNPVATPQSEPMPGKAQVQNTAGGYVFALDDWGRLRRFLVLGNEGGTYYASQRALTRENAACVERCWATDPVRTLEEIATISEAGRAPKNDPAIFALALCMATPSAASADIAAVLPRVCRTGTHLFQFLNAIRGWRGWGRGLRRAVQAWYAMDADRLALQVCKYRSREGWTHRDALRCSHARPRDPAHQAVFRFAVRGEVEGDAAPALLSAFTALSAATTAPQAIAALEQHPGLTWEMVPSALLGDPAIWRALIPRLPMTALIRNLGRMTASGALGAMSSESAVVAQRLGDADAVVKSRVHPVAVLSAMLTYGRGAGVRGGLTWTPISAVMDGLEGAYEASFGSVRPTNKRVLLALDVSGSMGAGEIAGVPGLTPAVASAAMAMVAVRTEPTFQVVAFSGGMQPISIGKRDAIRSVMGSISGLAFDRTDCALPMLWALESKCPVDLFVIYTDNETWFGRIHPAQALAEYRRRMGIDAKLAVVGMTATGFTIADPNDAGMMDVVGFDTATPNLLASFGRGE